MHSRAYFKSLIEPYLIEDEKAAAAIGTDDVRHIRRSQLLAIRAKTDRQLRTRELLQQHSGNANLVVLSVHLLFAASMPIVSSSG